MIAAHSLGIYFSGDYLFSNVSFIVSPGERIGLVGSNGAGKTTLMKIMIGLQQPNEGQVNKSRHARVGYLPQEGVTLSTKSVREEVMEAFSELTEMEDAMQAISEQVALRAAEEGSAEFEKLLLELGELQHRFEAMNGFSAVGSVEKVLMGLGFTPNDFERSCQTFSGGWQMRIELAKLLLQQPDLLMLDEPTNHLDIESLTWLEVFLQGYQGAILVISHDKTFLDALTNKTYEMSRGRLTVYAGNYSWYLKERESRRVLQQAAFENQQKEIADTERFIERFRYKATKSTQVQSRVKALDRLVRVEEPESDESSVTFRFPPAPRGGRVAAELIGVTKRYGDNLVLSKVDFALERGEKVAFLGRNGEGKSTLSRVIASLEPYEGTCTLGHNTVTGYFAQHQAEDLDPRKNVLETLDAVAVGDIRTQLRSLLGAFLFQGDDVFKPVSVLSGGEKSRLALAKLLLQPVNLLVMDEPTNHLDIASKNVLKRALMAYDGALILVSHDRDFLDGIVGKCIEFRNKGIKEYIGGINEYLLRHQTETVDDVFGAKKNSRASGKQKDDGDVQSRKDQKRREAEQRNQRYKATKEIKKKLVAVEKFIEELEEKRTACEEELAKPEIYGNPEKVRDVKKRRTEIEAGLAKNYAAWEKYASQIQEAEADVTASDV